MYSQSMGKVEIAEMSTAERLAAMEALWNALCREGNEPSSPAWHEDVLARRRRSIESGDAKFLSLDEVERRLRA
jgi:hypothetical protein